MGGSFERPKSVQATMQDGKDAARVRGREYLSFQRLRDTSVSAGRCQNLLITAIFGTALAMLVNSVLFGLVYILKSKPGHESQNAYESKHSALLTPTFHTLSSYFFRVVSAYQFKVISVQFRLVLVRYSCFFNKHMYSLHYTVMFSFHVLAVCLFVFIVNIIESSLS